MDEQRMVWARVGAFTAGIVFLGTSVTHAALPLQSENFDDDPLWVSSNNTTSPNNYGFANSSHITGASAGEAGGNISTTNVISYYGDPAADGLTLYTNLVASGRLTVDVSSGIWFLGWFDRDQPVAPTLLGFRFVEPLSGSSPYRVQIAYVRPDTGGDQRESTLVTLDTGKDYDWTFSYDPTANSGFGEATATFTGIDVVDTEVLSMTLHPSDKPRGSVFDTFGILRTPVGDGTTSFFIDNLTYTIPEPSSLALVGLFLTHVMLRRKTAAACKSGS